MNAHETKILVRYSETDAMGIVHHSSYLAWFEVGRVELMRFMGHSYREVEKKGTAFPVIDARLRYIKASHFDEELTIRTFCLKVTKVRVRFGYEILRKDEQIAYGYTEHAALGPRGRPVRLPIDFRQDAEKFIPEEDEIKHLRF